MKHRKAPGQLQGLLLFLTSLVTDSPEGGPAEAAKVATGVDTEEDDQEGGDHDGQDDTVRAH